MLTQLAIRDFAIVEHLELNLHAGFTVITGETGAGKSIMVDALDLALGGRADSGVVRHNAERAEVSAGFDVSRQPTAQRWLQEQELDADGDCLLRRTVTRDGRSKGYINGSPVTLQLLQELGEMLVDIHGQHEHQSLLKRDMQRQLLDDYAGHGALLEQLAGHYRHWRSAQRELETLQRSVAEREARLDLLNHQVRELEALQLGADELAALNEEHARLANAGRLLETSHSVLHALYENETGSTLSQLVRSALDLRELSAFDARLGAVSELLEGAAIQVREAASELRHIIDSLDLDPARLTIVEQRIRSIHDLARKHRLLPEELLALFTRLSDERDTLQHADTRVEQLRTEAATAENAYRALAQTLSAGRIKSARALTEKVSAAMGQLGMPGGRFDIVFEALADAAFSAYGMERVEFLVSANPGQPPKPLNKVASGGELSRISLAIQVIAAQSGRIPTLIFDEVDVGIGGGIAEIVGNQLRALGENRQVLCVTHLPQVAAQGQQHLQVSKQSGKGETQLSVNELSAELRRDEVARMLGGVKITEQTRAHATEMLQHAQSAKSPKKKKAKN